MDGWMDVSTNDGQTDGGKYKQTDGQTDEMMTAIECYQECYWPIEIGLKSRHQ